MTEIRKMVYQDKLWKDKSIKKLHMLSYLRLPSLLLIHMLSVIVSIHMCSEFIRLSLLANSFHYHSFWKLILFSLFIFWFMPKARFILDKWKSYKAYGKVYELIITENGYCINQIHVPWKKKKVITYKFGTAVTSFNNIAAIFPTHSFTKEEYNIIQNWLKNIG